MITFEIKCPSCIGGKIADATITNEDGSVASYSGNVRMCETCNGLGKLWVVDLGQYLRLERAADNLADSLEGIRDILPTTGQMSVNEEIEGYKKAKGE